MKKLLFTLTAFLVVAVAIAQKDTIRLKNDGEQKVIVTDRAPQAVYLQFLGSAPILSINYDRRFSKKLNGAGFAAGVGFWGASGVSVFSIPVSVNYLFGRTSSFIEAAAGATYISATALDLFDDSRSSGSTVFFHINLGYRYQPTHGGFFFRGGISPLFLDGAYITSYYIGFGHNF